MVNSKINVNVLHLNIRSLHKNLDNLVMLLSDMRDEGIIVHLIGICETHLSTQTTGLVDIENYLAVHRPRITRPGGGISIYMHDSLKLIQEFVTPFDETFESCAIETKFRGQSLMFTDFYRVLNTSTAIFMNSLRQLVTLGEKFKTSILCADQNLDILKLDHHHPTQEFISYMHENGYVSTMLKSTRVTHSTCTLIDNIYVKNTVLKKHESLIIVDHMSDHYPCMLSYAIGHLIDKTNVSIEKRRITESALSKIRQDLLFYDWSELYNMNANDGYNYVIDAINSKLDVYAPKKIVHLWHCDRFREPWMNVKLRKFNVKCRKLCKKAKNSRNESDFKYYKSFRNIVDRIKAYEKKTHYRDLFQRIGKNSKLLWNVVNNILCKCNNKNEITEIQCESKLVTDRVEICDTFNEHFATAGKKVQNTIKPSNVDPLKYVKKVNANLLFSPVSESQIFNIVQSLKSKSSSGHDCISNVLLKQLISVLQMPLCVVFNVSLITGEFPEQMKIAKVLLLHKGGAKTSSDNYRPISLLPVISKVLEWIVFNYLSSIWRRMTYYMQNSSDSGRTTRQQTVS